MNAAPGGDGARRLLELWHPSGAPARLLGLGGAAPSSNVAGAGERADVVLVAPLESELSVRWLERAIERAADALAPDGVLCVVVPRGWRRACARLVGRAGLATTRELLTAPPWPHTSHVLSLEPTALRDGGQRQLAMSPGAAACAGALVRSAGGRAIVRRAARGWALVAARPGAPDPLRWLCELDATRGPCAAGASIGPHPSARVAVVLRHTPARRGPDLVAKVALDRPARARIASEAAALAGLGAAARHAGAAVPSVVSSAQAVLAMSAVDGRPASVLLARDPARAAAILAAVGAWLRRWTAATARAVTADVALLERLLLAPAARLRALDGERAMGDYLAALRALADRLEGRPLVLAAAHNDLTMSNVLVAGRGVGVVDWESGCAQAVPLGDLWYALADGVARVGGTSHAEAVGALARRAPACAEHAAAADGLARELGLTADEALLSFHACWLAHAADELDRGRCDGRFQDVVRGVAAGRLRWPAAGGDAR